jgi:NADH-quinone oxidoreductase subunit L
VGLPIANGFFSKELVLEGGLARGPAWAYAGMLLGAGLTALYALRMVWMVFYAPANGRQPDHDGHRFMRFSLAILAIGALTTWLLSGPFGELLAETLPFAEIHVLSAAEMTAELFAAPSTWLALAIVALGLGAWVARGRLLALARPLRPLADLAADELGFEAINQAIAGAIRAAAAALSRLQTGQLNWNVASIVGALLALLVLLAWGLP